jgi:uncharacterized membrane protein
VPSFRSASPYLLAAFLAGAGATHFTNPSFYDQMVPDVLPGPDRAWTWGSGVAEIAVASYVLRPRTRRRGALAAAALFVAVFPANVKMAVEAETASEQLVTYARLPLQLPLVVWAWRVFRQSRPQ